MITPKRLRMHIGGYCTKFIVTLEIHACEKQFRTQIFYISSLTKQKVNKQKYKYNSLTDNIAIHDAMSDTIKQLFIPSLDFKQI
jgi:hypothetical protein